MGGHQGGSRGCLGGVHSDRPIMKRYDLKELSRNGEPVFVMNRNHIMNTQATYDSELHNRNMQSQVE